jgi:transposase InsO family protein
VCTSYTIEVWQRDSKFWIASGEVISEDNSYELWLAGVVWDWRNDYKEDRPHGAIGRKPPISLHLPAGAASPSP